MLAIDMHLAIKWTEMVKVPSVYSNYIALKVDQLANLSSMALS